MFDKVTLRGARASIVWGYRTAAALTTWSITKDGPSWILRASVEGVDRFLVKQTSPALIFTAPRHYGQSCWPIVGQVLLGDKTLVATLGMPEQ